MRTFKAEWRQPNGAWTSGTFQVNSESEVRATIVAAGGHEINIWEV